MRIVDLAPAEFGVDPRFSGSVSGADFIPAEDPSLHAFVVSFEAGSRTAWHSHANGQLLICIEGRGYVGTRDGKILELVPGGTVWTDPAEEHWHGAAAETGMKHIAVQTRPPESGEREVHWLEPVNVADTVGR